MPVWACATVLLDALLGTDLQSFIPRLTTAIWVFLCFHPIFYPILGFMQTVGIDAENLNQAQPCENDSSAAACE